MVSNLESRRAKCVHALTQYDIAQSSKRGYNRYALAMYLNGLNSAISAIEGCDEDPKAAFEDVFCDRVLDVAWKAFNSL